MDIIENEKIPVEKLVTGIDGFDLISQGGLPKGRTTLLSGTAGSAKTVFAAQFLAEGIRKSATPGVFVTFEEPPEDIRKNMLSMRIGKPFRNMSVSYQENRNI